MAVTEREAAVGARRAARFAGVRWAALAFFVALAVRLIAIWVVGPVQLEFGDAHDFLETSRIVCTQEEYPATGNITFFRAPGYPLFVSLVTACHPDRILRVKVCNALVDSLTVVLIWVLAGQMIPTAAGREWRVIRAIRAWAAERNDVILRDDVSGNLHLSLIDKHRYLNGGTCFENHFLRCTR